MLRRVSASSFALVMVAIIALRIPALGFCLCEHDLIINGGFCCPTAAQPAATPSSHCDCCPEAPVPSPCDDCVVVLSLDPGEFLWTAHSFSPAPPHATPVLLPVGLQDEILLPATPASLTGLIRGSPPSGDLAASSRTEVLRL